MKIICNYAISNRGVFLAEGITDTESEYLFIVNRRLRNSREDNHDKVIRSPEVDLALSIGISGNAADPENFTMLPILTLMTAVKYQIVYLICFGIGKMPAI